MVQSLCNFSLLCTHILILVYLANVKKKPRFSNCNTIKHTIDFVKKPRNFFLTFLQNIHAIVSKYCAMNWTFYCKIVVVFSFSKGIFSRFIIIIFSKVVFFLHVKRIFWWVLRIILRGLVEWIGLIQLIFWFTKEVFKFLIVLNQLLLFVILEFAIFLLDNKRTKIIQWLFKKPDWEKRIFKRLLVLKLLESHLNESWITFTLFPDESQLKSKF